MLVGDEQDDTQKAYCCTKYKQYLSSLYQIQAMLVADEQDAYCCIKYKQDIGGWWTRHLLLYQIQAIFELAVSNTSDVGGRWMLNKVTIEKKMESWDKEQ